MRRLALVAGGVTAAALALNIRKNEASAKSNPLDEYKYIVVGGGTGGCITAYTLAKLMQESSLPGRVLLLDAGDGFFDANGPHPHISEWFNNWAKFSVAHETEGEGYNYHPSSGSTHIGLGGAGTHDTRITFYPREEQMERLAMKMGWTTQELMSYYQIALDMMPLKSARYGERFFDAALQTLEQEKAIKTVDELEGRVLPGTAGYVSVAMFDDENRWTSAYLVDPNSPLKPENLDVQTRSPVNKVLFDRKGPIPRAIGVLTQDDREIVTKGEVVITAGSLETPAILQRSGIGPRSVLEAHSIDVVVANDEVPILVLLDRPRPASDPLLGWSWSGSSRVTCDL